MPHGGIPEGGQLLQTHGIKWGDGSDSTADSAYFDTKGNLVINVGQGAGSIVLPGGAVLRSGAGAPSNSLGDNGDFYLDKNGTANACFYQRSGGVWSLLPTSGGSPNGAAGGSLTGNYPSPSIAALAVSTNMLASGAVTSAVIASGAVASFHIQSGAVGSVHLGSGQVGSAHYAPSSITAAKADSTIEKVANKGVANGYAGLDSGGHVPVAQLASGTPSSSTYVRGDGTWAAGTATPLSGLTDVNIASPADGNVLTYHSSAAKWQNDSRPERTFEFFGGSLTGNLTAQTNAWTAARTWSDTVGGGKILFGAGTYQHMPQLELGNHMSIQGVGMLATRLQFDSSITSGACVYNHVSTNGTTDPNAWAVRIQSLTLDGSLLPGWGTNAVNGITFDQNPRFSKATADSGELLASDAGHIVRDVFIYQMPQDGCVALAMGSQHWEQVLAYSCGRYGFQPPFDSNCFNLTSGFSRKEGFFITGNPVRIVGCKAFSAGNDAATRANGYGFHIATSGGFSPVTLVGCEAQDCFAGGYLIDGCTSGVALVGCHADSCSVSSAGTYPGVDVLNSPNVQIIGFRSVERGANGSNQTHAINVRGTSTAVHVEVEHVATNTGTISTPYGTIDSGAGVSFQSINNLRGFQSLAYTSSLTPDPFAGGMMEIAAMTATLSVNSPTNSPFAKGTDLRMILRQDGTGNRTVVWNATYLNTPTTNTAASAVTAARFVYDGTNWIGV